MSIAGGGETDSACSCSSHSCRSGYGKTMTGNRPAIRNVG